MKRFRHTGRMVYQGMKLYRTRDTAHLFFEESDLHMTVGSMERSRRLCYTKIKEPEVV